LELSEQLDWSTAYDVVEAEQYLRTTLKGLREDYRGIFELTQPHLYFAEYISLMQECLESDVDEGTISDHEIDRKQMFNESEYK